LIDRLMRNDADDATHGALLNGCCLMLILKGID
jgi:hypothetical protein